jgi:hypothetical protein
MKHAQREGHKGSGERGVDGRVGLEMVLRGIQGGESGEEPGEVRVAAELEE